MQFKIGEKPGMYRLRGTVHSDKTWAQTDICYTSIDEAKAAGAAFPHHVILDDDNRVVYIHPGPAPRIVQPEFPAPPEMVVANGKWQEWFCSSLGRWVKDIDAAGYNAQYKAEERAIHAPKENPQAVYDPFGRLCRVIPPAVRWESADEEGVT